MNPFQLPFHERLHMWRHLRHSKDNLSREEFIIEVDRWWQQAPQVKQHLHWNDQENWTDPWTMLSENTYCPLTRALGMIYSLVLCGIEDVELVTATDGQCEEHHLVLVDDKVLNYWPNTVKDNKISDFTIIRRISIDPVMNKIK